MFTSLRRASMLAVLALGLAAPSAAATPRSASGSACKDESLKRVFLPWADLAYYSPVPGGAFEERHGQWTLRGDANITHENEPFNLDGEDGKRSLLLPEGSQATSAPVCIGLEDPTLRFVARPLEDDDSALGVEVLYTDASGEERAVDIGSVVGLVGHWQPSLPMAVIANLETVLSGSEALVRFRFTPSGGPFQIDGLHVDPWRAR